MASIYAKEQVNAGRKCARGSINYRVLGTRGPWVALSPGGRRALENVQSLAQHLAAAGYRVLIHDRRNCGLSDIVIGGEKSEYEIWADDLYELLAQLNALPASVGGGPSGCRLSLLMALNHPQAVRALLLWRITGGAFAAQRLTENYYDKYIRAAREEAWPNMRARSLPGAHRGAARQPRHPHGDGSQHLHRRDERWRTQFANGAQLPIIGASEQDLNSIRVPTCIIPGNDKTHSHATAEAAHRMIPGGELHDMFPGDLDVDLVPPEDRAPREAEMAAIFADFLKRSLAKAA